MRHWSNEPDRAFISAESRARYWRSATSAAPRVPAACRAGEARRAKRRRQAIGGEELLVMCLGLGVALTFAGWVFSG